MRPAAGRSSRGLNGTRPASRRPTTDKWPHTGPSPKREPVVVRRRRPMTMHAGDDGAASVRQRRGRWFSPGAALIGCELRERYRRERERERASAQSAAGAVAICGFRTNLHAVCLAAANAWADVMQRARASERTNERTNAKATSDDASPPSSSAPSSSSSPPIRSPCPYKAMLSGINFTHANTRARVTRLHVYGCARVRVCVRRCH